LNRTHDTVNLSNMFGSENVRVKTCDANIIRSHHHAKQRAKHTSSREGCALQQEPNAAAASEKGEREQFVALRGRDEIESESSRKRRCDASEGRNALHIGRCA
jgi:hypothetical protein